MVLQNDGKNTHKHKRSRFEFSSISTTNPDSNLQLCTGYSFRIVSYTETGDLGHSVAKCFTKSVEILHKNADCVTIPHDEGTFGTKDVESDSGFKVRDLGKILRLAWIKERDYLDDITSSDMSRLSQIVKPETSKPDELPPTSHTLDLNVATVPDLNEELAPVNESSNADVDHGSGESENWANHEPNEEVPTVESRTDVSRKRPGRTESNDCDSALINMSPSDLYGNYCVKMICWLECEG